MLNHSPRFRVLLKFSVAALDPITDSLQPAHLVADSKESINSEKLKDQIEQEKALLKSHFVKGPL
jgi:hypothetical protein